MINSLYFLTVLYTEESVLIRLSIDTSFSLKKKTNLYCLKVRHPYVAN